MKRQFLLLCSLFLFGNLSASIEECLKPVGEKPLEFFNQLRNIDFIYTINLDKRPEKYAHCVNELAPYGLVPFRFSAVNGWELTLEQLNDLGVKYEPGMAENLWGTAYLLDGNFEPHHEVMSVYGRNYFCHCMTRGAIGICLSHLSILQDAFDSGYETIWVMEDDIEVIQDPRLLSYLIDDLDYYVGKDNWDILFTDQDTKDQNGNYIICRSVAKRPNFTPSNLKRFAQTQGINPLFRKVGARYGAYSMIVRRSGMEKLLSFLKTYKLFLPFDMEYTMPDDMNVYTLIYDVVSTLPRALSDNGAPNYDNKK